jgi:hypothetical protein
MELLHKLRGTICNLLVRRVHGQPVDNCYQKHLSFTTGDETTEVMGLDFLETYINLWETPTEIPFKLSEIDGLHQTNCLSSCHQLHGSLHTNKGHSLYNIQHFVVLRG